MGTEWLYRFLAGCVRAFDNAEAFARLDDFKNKHEDMEPDELTRRWVEYRLRQTGVIYGTPLASEQTIALHTRRGIAQRHAVFLAILRIEAELAMEVGCSISHCTRGHVRVAELLVCFALLCRKFGLAQRIHAVIPEVTEEGPAAPRLGTLAGRVARILGERTTITGNPLLGLPIHNSFHYVEAKTLGRLSVAYFERGVPDREAVQRVLDYQDREKELLLRVMLGLTLADRTPGGGSARVIARQIKAARLVPKTRRALLRSLRRGVSALSVAAVVNDDRTRDFLLEQVLLGAMLDGHFSERESVYIDDLAAWLGVSADELARREAEVVAFYETHKDYLDLFTVGTAVRNHRQRMLDRLQKSIADNAGLIAGEIRQTGDLAELLYRASIGEVLDEQERTRMRRQLIDVLRTIPSLAIFALPGGAVLLPLLFRFLPDSMKPRSFVGRTRSERDRDGGGII